MTLLRSFILGGVDGVVTSFAIVAGAAVTSLERREVLVVGTSSLFADGISMGISEFLAASAERAQDTRTGSPPWALGITCLLSFVMCGFVPIFMYLVTQGSLLVCASLSFFELLLLGSARTIWTNETLLWGLVQTGALGAVAGGVAYSTAWLLA